MFKYLVTKDDPQWVFSTTILSINCSCFFFIAVSYLFIGYKTYKSRKRVHTTGSQQPNNALQWKITAIIMTDFFCWIPLSLVSLFHLLEEIDATPWYPFFSILILPINSVINPFLYESTFYWKLIRAPMIGISWLTGWIRAMREVEEQETVATNQVAETQL